MRAIVIGLVGVAVSGVAAIGSGMGGPDDYREVVGRSPQAVYAAFAALGAEGEQPLPVAGLPLRVTQRITRVPDQKVVLEILVEGDRLLTAEIQLAPGGDGQSTQVSAEVDVNREPIERVIVASGGEVPDGVLNHGRVDDYFAQVMTEMMKDVEAGRPLRSIAGLVSARGQGRRGVPAPAASAARAWQEETPDHPQLGARPMVDPTPGAPGSAPATGGWGAQ